MMAQRLAVGRFQFHCGRSGHIAPVPVVAFPRRSAMATARDALDAVRGTLIASTTEARHLAGPEI